MGFREVRHNDLKDNSLFLILGGRWLPEDAYFDLNKDDVAKVKRFIGRIGANFGDYNSRTSYDVLLLEPKRGIISGLTRQFTDYELMITRKPIKGLEFLGYNQLIRIIRK